MSTPLPPPGQSKTVRFLGHRPIAPSHKPQTAGWLYGGALFLEGGAAGPSGQSSDLRDTGPGSPDRPRAATTEPRASVCVGRTSAPLLGVSCSTQRAPRPPRCSSEGHLSRPLRPSTSVTWSLGASPPWLHVPRPTLVAPCPSLLQGCRSAVTSVGGFVPESEGETQESGQHPRRLSVTGGISRVLLCWDVGSDREGRAAGTQAPPPF